MTPATAQVIVQYVKSYDLPSKLNVDQAEGVIVAWLKAIGWKMDAWGNYLHPDDPKTRYHFKKTQLNKQTKTDRGDWSNLSYTPSIDAALILIVSAAGRVGDQEMVQKFSKTKGKRKAEKQTRAEKEEEKRLDQQANVLAWKEYTAQRRGFIERMLLGKTSDEEVLKAKEEFLPLQGKWLAEVKAGKAPEDDQAFASADNPPILPVLKGTDYEWTETVDGVEYTVTVTSAGTKTAEINIGDAGAYGMSVSALTHGVTLRRSNLKGDAYISGKIIYRDEYRAALFLIMSAEKQKGAGTRALSIWCRMMAGYGIKQWVAEGVGDEGAAFFSALERKGKLRMVGRSGPNWVLECTGTASSNPTASRREITPSDARKVGEAIGIDWNSSEFDAEQFRRGMAVELEHGKRDLQTNVTDDDLVKTAKIAWAHLKEFPDYYYRLGDMEKQAEIDTKQPVRTPRVTVKQSKYHDRSGYLVFGTTAHGREFKYFVEDKEKAEAIRNELKKAKPGYQHRVDELFKTRKNPAKESPSSKTFTLLIRRFGDELVPIEVVANSIYGRVAVHRRWQYFDSPGDSWGAKHWNVTDTVSGAVMRADIKSLSEAKQIAKYYGVGEGKDLLSAALEEYTHQIYGEAINKLAQDIRGRFPEKNAEKNPSEASCTLFNPSGKAHHIRHIGTIGDWEVWSVKGGSVRDEHQEFVIGGNHGRYPWIPENQLWVEETDTAKDIAANSFHEAVEYWHMVRGMGYDEAHDIAEATEKRFRANIDNRQAKRGQIFSLKDAMSVADMEFSRWQDNAAKRFGKTWEDRARAVRDAIVKAMKEHDIKKAYVNVDRRGTGPGYGLVSLWKSMRPSAMYSQWVDEEGKVREEFWQVRIPDKFSVKLIQAGEKLGYWRAMGDKLNRYEVTK